MLNGILIHVQTKIQKLETRIQIDKTTLDQAGLVGLESS